MDNASDFVDIESLGRFSIFVISMDLASFFLLKFGRFEKKKRAITYLWCFCAVIASLIIGWELNTEGRNYYTRMNVTRHSTPQEIKKAYRRQSFQYHPDKNDAPDADVLFHSHTVIHDILVNDKSRRVYDKCGPDFARVCGSDCDDRERVPEYSFYILFPFYATWLVIILPLIWWLRWPGRFVTRRIIYGCVVTAFLDMGLLFLEVRHLPAWLLPRVTPYDCVWLLHLFICGYVGGWVSIGSIFYVGVDIDVLKRDVSLELGEQNKKILAELEEIRSVLLSFQHGGMVDAKTEIEPAGLIIGLQAKNHLV